MSICVLRQQEKISSSRKSILGVYSSPLVAWQIFSARLNKGRAPYTGGIFHYSSAESFRNAIALANPKANAIRIYSHPMFDIDIVWNVLDRSL